MDINDTSNMTPSVLDRKHLTRLSKIIICSVIFIVFFIIKWKLPVMLGLTLNDVVSGLSSIVMISAIILGILISTYPDDTDRRSGFIFTLRQIIEERQTENEDFTVADCKDCHWSRLIKTGEYRCQNYLSDAKNVRDKCGHFVKLSEETK